MPENSARSRQAAVNRSSSARRAGESRRDSVRMQRRHRQRVIFGRHQRRAAAQNPGVGAPLVDGEIVDHRLHGERHGVFQFALGLAHDDLEAFLGVRLAARVEQESHAAARHAAEHPEAPEIRAEFRTRAADQRLGIEVAGPRDDGLHGTVEIALGAGADGPDVAALQMAHDLVEDAHGLAAPLPLRFGAQQVLLRHHFQDGADVLRHAAVHQHQALLQLLACGARRLPPGRKSW